MLVVEAANYHANRQQPGEVSLSGLLFGMDQQRDWGRGAVERSVREGATTNNQVTAPGFLRNEGRRAQAQTHESQPLQSAARWCGGCAEHARDLTGANAGAFKRLGIARYRQKERRGYCYWYCYA